MDQAIAKARTATAKSSSELQPEKDTVAKTRKIEEDPDTNGTPAMDKGKLHLQSLSKLTAYKLNSGFYTGFNMNSNGAIIDGSPDESLPPTTVDTIKVAGENCVIRNVICNALFLADGSKVTVVDSFINAVFFLEPGVNDDAKKTKCDLTAGNCVVGNLILNGPRNYTVTYASGGDTHTETVSITNNNCQFKFKNCSFRGQKTLFTTSGDINIELSKCVISLADATFASHDRANGGKCSYELSDCAIYKEGTVTPSAFIQELRQSSGKAITRGKFLFLTEKPFECEAEKAVSLPVGDLQNMKIQQNCQALQMGSGAGIGENGLPDPAKAANAASKPPAFK